MKKAKFFLSQMVEEIHSGYMEVPDDWPDVITPEFLGEEDSRNEFFLDCLDETHTILAISQITSDSEVVDPEPYGIGI